MGSPDAGVFPPDLVQSGGFNEALRGMVNREFLASERHVNQHRRAVREGMHPHLAEFERLLLKRMARLGVPMFAAEVYRPPDRQAELKALGHSKVSVSAHQYGLAVDIVHGTRAWNLDERQWKLIGHVGKELAVQKGIKLRWGGDWGGDGGPLDWDPAHWEIKGWKDLIGGYPRWENVRPI